jgi:hypothetical protein
MNSSPAERPFKYSEVERRPLIHQRSAVPPLSLRRFDELEHGQASRPRARSSGDLAAMRQRGNVRICPTGRGPSQPCVPAVSSTRQLVDPGHQQEAASSAQCRPRLVWHDSRVSLTGPISNRRSHLCPKRRVSLPPGPHTSLTGGG